MATEASTNFQSQSNPLPSAPVEPELGLMNDEDDQQLEAEEVQGAAAATSQEDEVTSEKTKSSESKSENEDEKKDSAFECNICLDVASDAVISMCGHLFCWPCLHQWLETRPHNQICPVCKAGISREKVVPLYGRGSSDAKDPRDKPIPPRPRGQRSEPEPSNAAQNGFWGFGNGGGGFQMSFGIGAFPFGFFATNLNFGDNNMAGQAPMGSPQYEEEQFLHRVFLWIAFAFIFWLLIA